MKKLLAGFFLPLLLIVGLGFTGTSPASASAGNGCAFGFCYNATDVGFGGRTLNVSINPGNNNNMCVIIYAWNAGTPTPMTPRFQMTANAWTNFGTNPYGVFYDATVNATVCNTGAKIFTYKVSALNNPNGFI